MPPGRVQKTDQSGDLAPTPVLDSRRHGCDPDRVLRDLTTADARAVAGIARAARAAAIHGLPDLHTPAEDVAFYAAQIASSRGAAWVDDLGEVAGFVLWRDDLVEHLYVHPDRWRRGIGTQLLGAALAESGDREVRLWTFQANARALGFYRAHGFRIIASTDGSGTEERLPDHQMSWRPGGPERRPAG